MSWINPTGLAVRYDKDGWGNFGARRSGGKRKHMGLDILAEPGQGIAMPTSGQYRRLMQVYDGDPTYKGMEFQVGTGLYMQLLYVEANVNPMDYVEAGQWVATAQDVTKKHGGVMQPHIHVTVFLDKYSALIRSGEWNQNRIFLNPKIFFPDIEDSHASDFR